MMRLWDGCSFGDEGRVSATGAGRVQPGEHFTISANGVDVEMVAVEYSSDNRWAAIDAMTHARTIEAPA